MKRLKFRLCLILFFLVGIPIGLLGQVYITVTNNNSSGPGSLDQAYIDVDPGGLIDFDPSISGPITFAQTIQKDLTIEGDDRRIELRTGYTEFGLPSGLDVTGAIVVFNNIDLFTFNDLGHHIMFDQGADVTLNNVSQRCRYECYIVTGGSSLRMNSTSVYALTNFDGAITVSGNSTLEMYGSNVSTDLEEYSGGSGSLVVNSGTVLITDGSSISNTLYNKGGDVQVINSRLWGDYPVFSKRPMIRQEAGTTKVERSEAQSENLAWIALELTGGSIEFENSIIEDLECTGGDLKVRSSAVYNGVELNGCSWDFNNNILSAQFAWATQEFEGFSNSEFQNLVDNHFHLVHDINFPGSQDPLYERNIYETITGVADTSPAIDKGDCSDGIVTNDFHGVSRPVDTDIPNAPGGDGCDIGPFEEIISQPTTLIVTTDTRFVNGSIEWVIENLADGGTVLFDPSVSNKDIFLIQALTRDVTIDGQDQDITIRSGGGIGVDGANVTMQNLRYYMTNFALARMEVSNGGHLTMNDVEIDCLNGCMDADNGSITLNGVTATVELDEWFLKAANNAVITIDSSQVTQTTPSTFEYAVELLSGSELTIQNNSRLTGWVYNNSGTVSISDSRIGGPLAFYGYRNDAGSYSVDRSIIEGQRFGLRHTGGIGSLKNSVVTGTKDGVSCSGGSVDILNSTLTTQDPANWTGFIETAPCAATLYSTLAVETSSDNITSGGSISDYNFIVDSDLSPYIDPLLEIDPIYGYQIQPSSSSPLLDQGNCALHNASVDVLGEIRPWDPTSVANASGGDGCDIGAVERQILNVQELLIELKAILSGAWTGSSMRNDLHSSGLIPLIHPYVDVPSWGVSQFFLDNHPQIVDWVWLELRTGTAASTSVAKEVAFITTDGSLLNGYGAPMISLFATQGSYYVIIGHRNHLPIMTASPIALTDAYAMTVDLSEDPSAVYTTQGVPLIDLGGGKYGMWSGDGNEDRTVTAFDFIQTWLPQNGTNGYLSGDFNLSGSVTALDFVQSWLPANGKSSQVPD